jgi:hypothetical protein
VSVESFSASGDIGLNKISFLSRFTGVGKFFNEEKVTPPRSQNSISPQTIPNKPKVVFNNINEGSMIKKLSEYK